jgi:PIN domain nuclease of toxin-antitoxin system
MVHVLLDTHVLIWAATEPHRLAPAALSHVRSAESELLVSLAIVWEMSIKVGLSKLTLIHSLESSFKAQQAALGFNYLPIEFDHLIAVSALPGFHRDPSARLQPGTDSR